MKIDSIVMLPSELNVPANFVKQNKFNIKFDFELEGSDALLNHVSARAQKRPEKINNHFDPQRVK